MFLAADHYDYLRHLSENKDKLFQEYISTVQGQLESMRDTHLYAHDWKGFPLMAAGVKNRRHCKMCSQTMQLISNIPGLLSAGFYALGPHSTIPPHKNLPPRILRMHMGLIVPDGCYFRVGNEQKPWHEAEWLVFRPYEEHEAVNNSDSTRVIFLLDVWEDINHRKIWERLIIHLDGARFLLWQIRLFRPLFHMLNRNQTLRKILRYFSGERKKRKH